MSDLEKAQFDHQLMTPPPHEAKRPPTAEQVREEGGAFMSAMAGMNGGRG